MIIFGILLVIYIEKSSDHGWRDVINWSRFSFTVHHAVWEN